ncbi:peptidylprolyl isomerase [Paenibacillus sp. LHD-117]|uniref:peptidylprolyl isomerase n=1 Tax=Paenibacillus sp. LHD-117 TaxID=3071412 RepID=UPI0027DEE92C|nr:peptidylprolyl isomerase [Paenibacillus sp. LHD-117]MDQ6423639.1 peptidylprolyl isomerase [Paenibacillus sp. LHD-117]
MKAKQPGNRRKNQMIFLGTTVFVCLIAFAVIASVGIQDDQATVLVINGEEVSAEEYRKLLDENRAYTFSYFKKNYGVDHSSDFWESRYGNEKPIDVIRKKTFEDLVRLKVQQILAKQKGVVKDISYSRFLSILEEENSRRKEAVQKGQVIYGPEQYRERDYYRTTFDNLKYELKKKLLEEQPFQETELKQYYTENLESLFKKQDSIQIRKIYIPHSSEGELSESDAQVKMEELKQSIQSAGDFDQVCESLKTDDSEDTNLMFCEEQEFTEMTARSDTMRAGLLLGQAQELEVGQVSEVFEENDVLYIIKCLEKEVGRKTGYEEAKGRIQLILMDLKYEEIVNQLVKQASIQFMPEYDGIVPK